MTDTTFHRFAALTAASVSALLLFSLSNSADAKGKAKANAKAKAAPSAKADADKKETGKASDEAAKSSETDTDADAIFTEDEVKAEAAKEPKAEEKTSPPEAAKAEPEAVEAEPASGDKPVEPTAEAEAGAQPEGDAAADGTAVEDANVEVVASSSDKKFPVKDFDGPGAVRRDRGFNILTARATRPMSLTLCFDHRPYQSFVAGSAADVFNDYLGLDGAQLKVGIGARFGIIEGLDVGLYRLNDGNIEIDGKNFDTYEFDVRYAFLKQEKFFVDVSARAGLSWFSIKGEPDAVGGYGEIFVDHVFFDSFMVGAGFQIHSSSTNDAKKNNDDSLSGAVLGVLEWRIIKQLALTAEIAAPVVGYGSAYGNPDKPSFPGFSMGLKILTERHTFALLVSNTQYINADGIVSGSWREFSDIILGFQIFREFNFKKK
jgi:hypothetical protein